ncbi:MAG: exo-alpha-sialidase [Planctomycetota bacterium]
MCARTSFVVILAVLAGPASAGDRGYFQQTDVFAGGELGYKEFRIPALVVTKGGTLLAISEAGWTASDFGVRRSTDGGRSWSNNVQVIIDEGKSRCGSPAVIVDSKTGRIHLMAGVDSKRALHTCSDDDGQTWSEFQEITYVFEALRSAWDWTGLDTGPARGIELTRGRYKGRFVQPMWLTRNHKQYRSGVIYSDDRGATWKPGGLISEVGLNTNECSVYEAVDGTLWMNIRGGDALAGPRLNPFRLVATSSDSGLSWSKLRYDKNLICPRCLASTVRYSWPGEGRSRVLFANPANERGRISMTVRLSYDEGESWPVARQIFAGPSAYSCVARLPDGDIGLLFEGGERHRYQKMMFARFSLSWLTDGRDNLKAGLQSEGDVPPELATPNYRVTKLTGIGHEKAVRRQDPSNVIKVGDTYYVWYSKVVRRPDKPFSAYFGSIWYASSKDGINWTERGRALGKGPKGAWDSRGVLTPYVAVLGGHLFMFYTGTSDDGAFETNTTLRHIGLAMTDNPNSGWRKHEATPILSPSRDKDAWDSLLVDDAHLIVRDGKFWLYYKGRNSVTSYRHTRWGLAIADYVTGPYSKYEDNPITDSGHTVCVWPHREGVAALMDFAGPQRHTVQYAPDGIHFKRCAKVEPRVLTGCGPYDPDAFTNTGYGRGIRWGVAQDGRSEIYIVRFDCDLEAPNAR